MKPITLKKAMALYVDAVLENSATPLLFLRDGDGHYHKLSEIDLLGDRICCDDSYWDYYEFIMEAECGETISCL